MIKIVIALICFFFTAPSFVHGIQITELAITSVEHETSWRWDTDPINNNGWVISPIGVSGSLTPPTLLNHADRTVNFDLGPGNSIYLFTESFSPFPDLFLTEHYLLTIKTEGNTYSVGFGFGESYGGYIPPATSSPFVLSFKGFTSNLQIGEAVGQAFIGISGLSPDGSPDAVYELTYVPETTNVPEPTTLLLMGTGILGLLAIGRRRFFQK